MRATSEHWRWRWTGPDHRAGARSRPVALQGRGGRVHVHRPDLGSGHPGPSDTPVPSPPNTRTPATRATLYGVQISPSATVSPHHRGAGSSSGGRGQWTPHREGPCRRRDSRELQHAPSSHRRGRVCSGEFEGPQDRNWPHGYPECTSLSAGCILDNACRSSGPHSVERRVRALRRGHDGRPQKAVHQETDGRASSPLLGCRIPRYLGLQGRTERHPPPTPPQ